jgi:DNA-binding Xre family transcriptional regulator
MSKVKKADSINHPFNGKKLAADILAKREKDSLTYAKATKEIGVGNAILFRAESGDAVSVHSLEKICNWLGVKVQNYF